MDFQQIWDLIGERTQEIWIFISKHITEHFRDVLMYSFHTQHLSEITKLAHVKTECNYGEGVEGGTSPRGSVCAESRQADRSTYSF